MSKWVDADKLFRQNIDQEIRDTKFEEEEEGQEAGYKIAETISKLTPESLNKLRNKWAKNSRHTSKASVIKID